jgi:signal transduction histidine kinase
VLIRRSGEAGKAGAAGKAGEPGGSGELVIEVVDDGAGSNGSGGAGHGLAGMRERVAIYGGRLDAGREPGGGFALRARLPLGPAR